MTFVLRRHQSLLEACFPSISWTRLSSGRAHIIIVSTDDCGGIQSHSHGMCLSRRRRHHEGGKSSLEIVRNLRVIIRIIGPNL